MTVINFAERKQLKEGRDALVVNHATGKITSSRPPLDPELCDRLTRIRASLEKINRLMAELKETSKDLVGYDGPRRDRRDPH